ncbi:hypothetical protein DFQ26_002066, partial [Actinomortierella ambigua]
VKSAVRMAKMIAGEPRLVLPPRYLCTQQQRLTKNIIFIPASRMDLFERQVEVDRGQREEDYRKAREQREEDRRFAKEQREEDRRFAREQQEEDRRFAREQREEDERKKA